MGYHFSCKAHSSVSTFPSLRKSKNHRDSNGTTTPTTSSSPREIQHFTHSELASATSGFSDSALLGRGSHGSVFLASFPSGELLAVKRPSRPHPSEALNEIFVLSRILSPPSPRLVNLVGFTPSPPPLLVLEYMPNGSLFDLLHSPPPSRPPSWSLRLRLALQSAKALLFLHSHSPPVLHRDVKSANVLLDSGHNARLADFGLAVFAYTASAPGPSLTPPPAGTLGYLDPAYVTPEKLSPKTDVFSFGILLLEIISGRKAIDVSHSPPSILDWALPIIRRGKALPLFDPRIPPPRDPHARRHLAALAASCVRSSRDRRPSMEEVVQRLEVLRKTIPSKGWNGLHVTNPCSAVDTVRRSAASAAPANRSLDDAPSECPEASSGSGSSKNDDDSTDNVPTGRGDACARPPPVVRSRSSRRVFSDSEGGSKNLLDLMKAPNEQILRYRGGVPCSSIRRARTTVRVLRDCHSGKEKTRRIRRNPSIRSAFERLSMLAEEEKDANCSGGRVWIRAPR